MADAYDFDFAAVDLARTEKATKIKRYLHHQEDK
jgi:hypothetical protein